MRTAKALPSVHATGSGSVWKEARLENGLMEEFLSSMGCARIKHKNGGRQRRMMIGRKSVAQWLVWVLVLVGAGFLPAQEHTGKARRAVVTFEGKLEALPELTVADFQIQAGKRILQPARLYGPTELPTLIAIVLQENQISEFGAQLPALRDFILAQAPNTYVGLFYLSAQSVENAVPFDLDLQKVADGLRSPQGQQELAPLTPYTALAQILDYMHTLPDARKEVLFFTDGNDASAGGASSKKNPNLRQATELAQTAGIPVWVVHTEALPPPGVPQGRGASSQGQRTITTKTGSSTASAGGATDVLSGGHDLPGAAALGSNSAPQTSRPTTSGISYLKYLTEHSGGKVFSPGKFAKDIRPFLEEFQRLLSRQYVLEFSADGPLRKIKLTRKVRGARLLHPRS